MTDKLDRLVAETPAEVSPPYSLWPSVAKRLSRPQPALPRQLVASLLVGLLFGLLLGGVGGYQLQKQKPQLAMEPLLQALDRQHQQRLAQLPNQNPWIPAADLAELRTGSQQLYQAILQQPNNQQLFSLWLWTQQRELELLQPMHQQAQQQRL